VVGAALAFYAGILAALRKAGGFWEPEPEGGTGLITGGNIARGRLVGRRIFVRLGLIGVDQASV